MKDDKLYVVYIVECISRIEQYTVDSKESFLGDSKTRDAVLRNLQTLAESTQRISSLTRNAHAEVDWERIAGFRNVLAHDYLGINLVRVWEVVEHHLPVLKLQITAIKQQLERSV